MEEVVRKRLTAKLTASPDMDVSTLVVCWESAESYSEAETVFCKCFFKIRQKRRSSPKPLPAQSSLRSLQHESEEEKEVANMSNSEFYYLFLPLLAFVVVLPLVGLHEWKKERENSSSEPITMYIRYPDHTVEEMQVHNVCNLE